MNLKQIDAALSAYRTKLDDADNERLAFFRRLWGAQAEIAASSAVTRGYQVPKPADLRAWSRAGAPVLARAPLAIDAAELADALGRMGGVLVEHGRFPSRTVEAFARVKWDRIVSASDLVSAGSDPAAYVESFSELLVDDGMDEESARTGALAATLALRAMLDGPARVIQRARVEAGVDETHPVRCPVCGQSAAAAFVPTATGGQAHGKRLWCAQCGCAWDFERVRCGRCGTRSQAHLHYFNLEGDDAHRLATCDECGGYLRTVYQADALAPFSFEVEDVVMAKLDLVAYQQAAAAR